MPVEENNLLRRTWCATRRRNSIAQAASGNALVAIALLIVTVGVLAIRSRVVTAGQNTASWHTSKSSRMVECGGEELTPAPREDTRPLPLLPQLEPTHYLSPRELPLPELIGVFPAHGFRAPPGL